MKKLSRPLTFLGFFLVFTALLAFTMPAKSSAIGTEDYANWQSFHSAETIALIQEMPEFSPPTPNQDPCLHCHIAGYQEGAWVPLYRWLGFGIVGLVFLFGITRSLTTWNTRQPWVPYRTRVTELVNTTDPLAQQLDAPEPDWQRKLWYALGGIALLFFVLEVIGGVVGYFHMDPMTFDPEFDTHGPLIVSINNAHWGIGVLLVALTLGMSLIGTVQKSALRSWWATMLLITGVFGVPAIVQLSMGFFDPEMIFPAGHLFAYHILLIFAVFSSIASAYFIVTHKNSDG